MMSSQNQHELAIVQQHAAELIGLSGCATSMALNWAREFVEN